MMLQPTILMRNLDLHWIFWAMKLSIFFWWLCDQQRMDTFISRYGSVWIIQARTSIPSFAHATLNNFPTWNDMDLNFFGKTVGESKATNIPKTADCIPGIRKNYLATQLHLSYAYSSLQNMPPGMWSSLAAYSPNLITKNEVPVYNMICQCFITTRQSMEFHGQSYR